MIADAVVMSGPSGEPVRGRLEHLTEWLAGPATTARSVRPPPPAAPPEPPARSTHNEQG